MINKVRLMLQWLLSEVGQVSVCSIYKVMIKRPKTLKNAVKNIVVNLSLLLVSKNALVGVCILHWETNYVKYFIIGHAHAQFSNRLSDKLTLGPLSVSLTRFVCLEFSLP